MKFTLEAGSLHAAVKTVVRTISARNSIPILSFLHLTADDSGITLRGTNLDVEMRVTLSAEIEEHGVVALPAKMLADILGKLPKKDDVIVETGKAKGTVTVRRGRFRFVLQTLPAEDFPDLAAPDANHRFVMPTSDVKKLFETVRFAISTEETRYYLNGAYLHVFDYGKGAKALRATTTDGHKLASAEIGVPAGADGMPGIIVQKDAVARILETIDGHDQAELTVSAAKIAFSTGNMTMTAKNIDGMFPDYMRVVPSGNDKSAVLDRALAAEVADRVSTIRSERGPAVKLDFTAGSVKMSVTNPESGAAEEDIEIEYQSDPLQIGFNSRYLGDILGAISTDKVEIKLADAGSPTLFKPIGDESTFFVLMPMRV